MIIEMMLGMSVLVYAMNMYSSLVKEERRRANQSRDLCLEISGFNEKMLSETVALTIQDYEKIQKISSGKTFFYIALPEFYSALPELPCAPSCQAVKRPQKQTCG